MSNEPEFVTVALPKEIIDRIDRFVDGSNHQFVSRPHVIKVALSRFFKNNGGDGENNEIEEGSTS